MEEPKGHRSDGWIKKLESLERWGYLSAGLSFLVVGMITFGWAWYEFLINFRSGVLRAGLALTHELLFVVILLELFRTVINFLKSHTITLEPFLYVGIIAGTRRILTGSAQLGSPEALSDEIFNRYFWDIGLNMVIVLGLILAVFIYKLRGSPKTEAV